MEKVFGKVWLGNSKEAANHCKSEIETQGLPFSRSILRPIDAILNVADDIPEPKHSRNILYIHTGLTDGEGNLLEQYLQAILALDFLIKYKTEVLVYCVAGASRSSFIASCYLSWKLSICYEEAEKIISGKYSRLNVNKAHIDWLDRIYEALAKIT